MKEDKDLLEQDDKITLDDVELNEDNKKDIKPEGISLDEVNLDGESVKKVDLTKKEKSPKKINKTIIAAAISCVLGLGIGYTLGENAGRLLPSTTKNYSSSKVYATVGENKITGKQLAYKMEPKFYMSGKTEMTEDEILAYEAAMVDYMVTTEALYLAGVKEKVEVTDEEVDNEYMMLMSQIPQAFGMDEEAFLDKFDLDVEFVKSELKKELTAMKYMSEATAVSDEEVKNYYDKNKDEFLKVEASHILISNLDETQQPVDEETKKENEKKAKEILERANKGEDFASLAKEYSDDTSAEDGGELGLFGKGQMVPEFEAEAFSLEVGQVSSEIVETDYGYHILKKTDEKYDELSTIQEDLKTKLSYDKQNTLIDNLFEEYKVVNKLEEEINKEAEDK